MEMEREMDFKKWVSWNVKNHRRRSVLEAESTIQEAAGTGRGTKVVDWKLRRAEMNKVRVSASQDGSGDYSTISEALATIPPGVYRTQLHMRLDQSEAKLLRFAFQGPTLRFIIAVFMGPKTLFMITTRAFNNCFIQGSVDFIFGYGTSLYENCYLNSIAKKVASLTAQKRSSSTIGSGFSFKNSVVKGSGGVYLGRSWGDYSRVVVSYTFMDYLVLPQGWSDWGDQKRDTVYYGEYMCSGPGANLTGRVPWARLLTDEEAKPFLGT